MKTYGSYAWSLYIYWIFMNGNNVSKCARIYEVTDVLAEIVGLSSLNFDHSWGN